MNQKIPWYVIQTKPKKEKEVQKQLNQVPLETFYPLMQGMGSPKPLFPRYLFVRTDLQESHTYRLISFTRGVHKILGDPEGPWSAPKGLVETLMAQTRDGSLMEQTLLFKESDLVQVKRGFLKDLQGIIEKNLTESGRVKVLFQWMSGPMRAVLKYSELEKAA